APASRPSLEGEPRPVPDPGLGDDAGADDRGRGVAVLRAVPGTFPGRPGAGRGGRGRGPEDVGGAGLLSTGAATASGRPEGRRRAWRGFPRRPRGDPGVA